MSLICLPPELLGAVFEFVADLGINHALTARLVCSMSVASKLKFPVTYSLGTELFDVEITAAICRVNLLERPDLRNCRVGIRLASEYLLARVMANDGPYGCPSYIIHRTVDLMLEAVPDLEYLRNSYLRTLCYAHCEYWLPFSDWRTSRYNHAQEQYLQRGECANMLAAAAYLGIELLCHELLESGTPHEVTFCGPPVFCAVKADDLHLVRLMIKQRDHAQRTLYHTAVIDRLACSFSRQVCTETLQGLLDPETDEGIPSDFYRNLLGVAVRLGHAQVACFILERARATGKLADLSNWAPQPRGGVPTSKNLLQEWILLRAAQGGQVSLALEAIRSGADPNAKWYRPSSGMSPLVAAARAGHSRIVSLLLDYRGSGSLKDLDIQAAALVEASARGFDRVVDLFIDRGFDLNRTTRYPKMTALMAAIRTGQAHVVAQLLAAGANFGSLGATTWNQDGVRDGYVTIVDLLTKQGLI